jgi:LacI family transcriptional regulator
LSGQVNPSTGVGRFAGYCDALEEAGIAFNPGLVAVSGYTVAGGAEAMKAILARNQPRPTAVFPLTLAAATGAMMVLHANRISVPADMSVVTVHDGPMAEVMFPQLTTVRMPVKQMGYDGAKALVDLIDGRRVEVKRQLDPIELVVRASTSAAPGR